MKDEQNECAAAVLIEAHIYVNKTTGKMLFCSNKHDGDPRDFDYVGTANVPEDEVKLCELA